MNGTWPSMFTFYYHCFNLCPLSHNMPLRFFSLLPSHHSTYVAAHPCDHPSLGDVILLIHFRKGWLGDPKAPSSHPSREGE